jgi:CDP-4-dehydro-6-deoxyglucose reductase/ferredoxin-NAD(P)+ reductase (naphthalene dioxygenase ferredoxin-specific)
MTTYPRHYTGRVIEVHDISPDTRKLTIEIDNKQRLDFIAGQYARLLLPGFEERSFSIASAPHENFLEFHIKNSGQGMSAHIVEDLKPGSPVGIKGPLGTSHWRPAADRPLLALAGGIGIAPLKSIVDACLHDRAHPPVYLYWGTRNSHQLYLDDHFRALGKKYPRFSYIPVLSEETDNPYCRTGPAGSAVLEDFDTLSGISIYMAGPKAMIDSTLPLLLQKGAEEDYVFSDGFAL